MTSINSLLNKTTNIKNMYIESFSEFSPLHYLSVTDRKVLFIDFSILDN